jgi:hypothetical protein
MDLVSIAAVMAIYYSANRRCHPRRGRPRYRLRHYLSPGSSEALLCHLVCMLALSETLAVVQH